MTTPIILASTSPFRRQLLEQAGLSFTTAAPDIDEREIEGRAENESLKPFELSALLAQEKALAVSRRFPEALVIGGDQVMALGDRVFHKPANRSAARDHLISLRGMTHSLLSGLALAKGGTVLWQHLARADLTMRPFSDDFLETYLDRAGERIFKSVGGYQIEGLGIQLFSAVNGDYFTIVGVPLLPLLEELRRMGEIDG
ncbi:Maf family nucleotide pyrophosphatase [Allorhizobium sp. BGMRC 0089]|uniref:Maf family nucleotide pyrophosphatase n=1 Tax=Allorhizobium sonneratiae TaxID=2934936 RepID=UPI0020341C51|nr:Maf family nucleotide pyrophosphatase [Allorhizobium sonneratiae]MCM2294401.1 Maf family nucleotide pyrophosphatase [Allorhizobium sonneratiae]